jgi:hypothetical protein
MARSVLSPLQRQTMNALLRPLNVPTAWPIGKSAERARSASWLSLVAEVSESDDGTPSQPGPCQGGLSCEIEPYPSQMVPRPRLFGALASRLRGLSRIR